MRANILRHSHPSTLAGATLLGVIALAFALTAAFSGSTGDEQPPASTSVPREQAGVAPNVARSLTTSNVRAAPRPDAEVVAVIPVDRDAELVARAGSGAWLLVAYPPDGPEGWLPAQRLEVDAARIEGLPEVAPPAPEATPPGDGSGLPDLAIAEIYVVAGNRLAFRLQNRGDGPLIQVALGLALTVPGAEEPAVLRVEVAALEPGGTAAVVTPVVLPESGDVTIELDPDAEIEEADEANNARTDIVALGGTTP